MNKACGVFTTLNTVMSTLITAWTTASIALGTTPLTEAPKIAGDTVLYPIDGMASYMKNGMLELGPVNLMCNFVTCKLDIQNKILDYISLGYNDVGNSLAEMTCGLAEKDKETNGID